MRALSKICGLGVSVLIAVGALSGCATAPDDTLTENRDPYENTNRKVFAFNTKVDDYVYEPAAKAYLKLPDRGQMMLTNFANWTSLPSTAVNSSFQGDVENAAIGTFEFLINGLTLGFADLTGDKDTPRRTNFDDTLSFYNVGQGSYVVLPLYGSGTVRSHSAFFVDSITNPLNFAATPAAANIAAVNTPVRIVTFRGNNFEYINELKYNSLDSYARTRSIYLQYDDANEIDADENYEDEFNSFIETQE